MKRYLKEARRGNEEENECLRWGWSLPLAA